MERNKASITSTDQILNALWKAHEVAKTLLLTRAEMEAMMKADTIKLIEVPGSEEAHHLAAFASGAIQAHVQLTLKLCCEFVFWLPAHEGANEVRVFGLNARGPHEHFVKMNIEERQRALSGYVWLDTEGLAQFGSMQVDKSISSLYGA